MNFESVYSRQRSDAGECCTRTRARDAHAQTRTHTHTHARRARARTCGVLPAGCTKRALASTGRDEALEGPPASANRARRVPARGTEYDRPRRRARSDDAAGPSGVHSGSSGCCAVIPQRAQRQRFQAAHARALLMLRGRSARGRLGMAPGRLGMAPGRLGMAQGRHQPAGGCRAARRCGRCRRCGCSCPSTAQSCARANRRSSRCALARCDEARGTAAARPAAAAPAGPPRMQIHTVGRLALWQIGVRVRHHSVRPSRGRLCIECAPSPPRT